MHAERKLLTAAAVLKAIREDQAKDLDSLAAVLADRSPGHVGSAVVGQTQQSVLKRSIDRIVRDLQSVGAIKDDSGRLIFDEAWYDNPMFPVRNIGLSKLDDLAQPDSLVVRPHFGQARYDASSADIFVVSPFKASFKSTYDCIMEIAAALSLKARRGDDFFTARDVMDDVWSAIMNSKVVIADCTDRNPNVFYEIGIARTIGTPVILITQRTQDVPFDLRSQRYIRYTSRSSGLARLAVKLKETLCNVLGLDVSAACV